MRRLARERKALNKAKEGDKDAGPSRNSGAGSSTMTHDAFEITKNYLEGQLLLKCSHNCESKKCSPFQWQPSIVVRLFVFSFNFFYLVVLPSLVLPGNISFTDFAERMDLKDEDVENSGGESDAEADAEAEADVEPQQEEKV